MARIPREEHRENGTTLSQVESTTARTKDDFFHAMLENLKEQVKGLPDDAPEYKIFCDVLLYGLTQSKRFDSRSSNCH